MEFLKKRSTAAVIAVAIAVIFAFIGTSRSLNSLAKNVERKFTEGVDAGGYTQPALQRQLENRATAAMGLVTIGNHYPELKAETEALSHALHELQDAEGIESKYLCNKKLEEAYLALDGRLLGYVNQADAAARASYVSTLSGAQSVIGQSFYNREVSEYYRTARSFPASVFGIFARGPEFFGAEG